MPEYFDELHRKGMKTVMILDPALVVNDTNYSPYLNGVKNNVFIKWPQGQSPDITETGSDIMLGYVSKIFSREISKINFIFIYFIILVLASRKSCISRFF